MLLIHFFLRENNNNTEQRQNKFSKTFVDIQHRKTVINSYFRKQWNLIILFNYISLLKIS